jgi:hypothetical protein
LAIPFLALIVLSGCDESPSVVSLHPLYDERTLTFDPALAGAWLSEDDSWTFIKTPEGNMYRLQLIQRDSEEKTMYFEAALAQLAGVRFLDLCSDNTGETGAPAHAIFRFRLEDDKVELQQIDNKWLAETVASEGKLSYLKHHEKVVITASTIDLQYFLQHHATDSGAFPEDSSEVIQLTRDETSRTLHIKVTPTNSTTQE